MLLASGIYVIKMRIYSFPRKTLRENPSIFDIKKQRTTQITNSVGYITLLPCPNSALKSAKGKIQLQEHVQYNNHAEKGKQ